MEATSVSVFVALKESSTVQLQIFEGVDPSSNPLMPATITNTIALGQHLHVAMLTAHPSTALVAGKVYGYQLRFGTGQTLGSLGLLSGSGALGYGPGKLPGFALAPAIRDMNFVHGSCRKPHGEGRDALAAIDYLLADNYQNAATRPHYLFLTGDQIYADDVAVCLCATLRATANELLGWQEAFPRSTSGATVSLGDTALAPGATRKKFLADEAKLSSGETEGHLMFLGEFYAMFLMVWSPELWPRSTSGADAGRPVLPSVTDVLPQDAPPESVAKATTQRFLAVQFAQSIQRVRRVLANIPTYMIFDDHEVTDDWFIHRKWEADSRASPSTRRIIRNGLIAYAVFQAWGNDPAYFTNTAGDTPPQKLFEAVKITPPATAPPIHNKPDLLDNALDLRADGRLPDGSRDRIYWGWGFQRNGHQVIALDIRTRRQFPAASPKAVAGLMSSGALTDLAASAPNDDRITILLSPTPVFGNPRIELLQRGRVNNAKPGTPAEEQNDNEAWSFNRPVFELFLRVLARFKRVVVLSGDVHYGFSNQVAYFQNDPPPTLAARFVHLCSSSFKNEEALTRFARDAGYHILISNDAAPLRVMGWLGFDKDLTSVFNDVKAKLKPALLLLTNKPGDQAFVSSLLAVEGAERFKRPAVVPTNGWYSDDAKNVIQGLLNSPNGPPGWQYLVTYLTDGRDAESQKKAVVGLAGIDKPDKGSTKDHLVRTILFDQSRDVVGNNNFGRVFFESQDGQVAGLVHQLYRVAPSPDGAEVLTVDSGTTKREVWTFTEHKAPLRLPAASERPTVTK